MELIIEILSFLIIVFSIFILFDIKFNKKIKIKKRKKEKKLSLKEMKKESFRQRYKNKILIYLKILNKEKEFDKMILMSYILSFFAIIFCILLNNLYLILPITFIASITPFIFIYFNFLYFKKNLDQNITNALIPIINSYNKTDNIIYAIENNLNFIKEPLKGIFEEFLFKIKNNNTYILEELDILKTKLPNKTFVDFCDNLKKCIYNKNQKHLLFPIIIKLNNQKEIEKEMNIAMYEPIKEYTTIVIINIFIIFGSYFINPKYLNIITHTEIGKILSSIFCITIIFGYYKIFKLTKVLEDKINKE